jgi:putative ABC transport system ATP-binding protein
MELIPGLVCQGLAFGWSDRGTGGALVLESIEAVFPPGSVSLVTGRTGAGKSTLLHLLAGLLRPTAGEVRADGHAVSRWPDRHRTPWRRQVGIVFQHLALMPDLSVAENLLLPLVPRDMAWHGMQNAIRDQLAAVGLSDLAGKPAGALSGGQRQRLAVARALVSGPRFILADEPTAFQDDVHAVRIGEILGEAARGGAIVVIGSHDPRLRDSDGIDRRFRLSSAKLTPVDVGKGAP